MDYRTLGESGIEVSEICLGTMTWGEQNNEAEAHQQLDFALEQGVNFIDTAELYPVPPREQTQGRTERHIGSWLQERRCRDKVVLASKIAGPRSDLPYFREGRTRFDDATIVAALEQSLQRLQTEYLDIYYLHWPDRKANFFGQLGYRHDPNEDCTPLEETLEALQRQVEAGKVRAIGLSNETPWGVMQFLHLAQTHDWPRIAAIQNPYNLLNRTYEIGLAEISDRENCPLAAYSPLAFGALTGKYLSGAQPAGARLTLFPYFDRYSAENARQATQAYVDLARQHGLDPAQMAIAFVQAQSFTASTIIGATSMEQLAVDISAFELKLSDGLLEEIDKIHQHIPNPAP
jgi:aryl-alcohol dehydrogenase-like predicted oxidoreductase